MSNATANQLTDTLCDGPFIFDLPVKGSTHIYKGTLICQHSGGYAVPLTTSGGGAVIGVAQFEINNTGSDGDKRVRVETKRGYALKNGAGGDAFSDTSKVGAPVYASDDHTVADNSGSATLPCIGYFLGFEDDGKVRVFVDPGYAFLVNVLNGLQLLTDSPATVDALRDDIVAKMAGLL
jgi:predicted RecA/RadA family phage recombinase